ncbi:MAG: hypothetical protein ING75_07760 [Rhodocyclaceae bacterium]|nr:hypothetical protein [Rhodocyclaceae bacterium]
MPMGTAFLEGCGDPLIAATSGLAGSAALAWRRFLKAATSLACPERVLTQRE